MNVDWVREYCLSLPHATEMLQWGDDLLFKIGGKMFATLVLEPAPVWLSFKCSPEEFAELTERPGIIPAPYLARHQWVALQTREALNTSELQRLLHESYCMVLAKLSKRTRAVIAQHVSPHAKAKSTNKRRLRRKAR